MPQTIYKIFFKNGQIVTLKGMRSTRDAGSNTFEIYKNERKDSICARFELSEIMGVTFDKER